jgi:hypothetical protein
MSDIGVLFVVKTDQTNRGPVVKPDEAEVIRAAFTQGRSEWPGADHVAVPISLFERLIHTAEK